MATKEMERKALEQIKDIVKELGENSYIGMAFEGVFELAEENIDSDFGNSTKFYIDSYRDAEKAREAYRKEAKKSEEEKEYFRQEAIRQADFTMKAEDENAKLNGENYTLKRQVAELETEIIKLKAKLYDLLIKEE